MTFVGADYQLAWPRELFVAEAGRLLSPGAFDSQKKWTDQAALVLTEAFVGTAPADAFLATHPVEQNAWLASLVTVADSLVPAGTPGPYWPDRQGRSTASMGNEAAQRRFVALVSDFMANGYLDSTLPQGCVDDTAYVPNPADVIEERLDIPGLWPLRESLPWDDDTWFGLIEVFHDLVARPRYRIWHDWNECGWHWSEFAIEPGRLLYRWKVNQLLERCGIRLRLASEGEDVGRLVSVTEDSRDDLLESLITGPDGSINDRIRHAVALFRGRAATTEEKRSAVLVLAGVLEERRTLLKDALLRKDEGALFQIANEFAVRHQTESQKADYDPAFLDWIFWWFAATIELTNRVLDRQGGPR